MTKNNRISKPIPHTDAQVKDMAAGKNIGFGEARRPVALTAKQVEELRKGREINFEILPTVGHLSPVRQTGTHDTPNSRPVTLNDKEVAALRKGKEINLDTRGR